MKRQVELEAEQVIAIVAKLLEHGKADAMTGEQFLEQNDFSDAMLTPEQKDVLAMIRLQSGRGGGISSGGRSSAGGSSTGGSKPTAGAPPRVGVMGMGSGINPDETPFAQEVNQKRLNRLLAKLAVSTGSDVGEKSE